MFADEGVSIEVPEPPAVCDSLEGAKYKDRLERIGQADFEVQHEVATVIARILAEVGHAVPQIDSDVTVTIEAFVKDMPQTIDNIFTHINERPDKRFFKDIIARMHTNQERQKGVRPSQYKFSTDIVEAYLVGSRLEDLFKVKVPFAAPDALRYEHTWMLAGTGHGKTQTMQHHIAEDIKHLGERSVVVIDSQGDMTQKLARLDIPKEKVVYIDPEDRDFPVALNLFALGQSRFDRYDALAQDQLQNNVVELLEFVLSGILGTALTGQQSIIFRYSIRLLLTIPDATILTFLDLLEERGEERYAEYIQKLDGTPRMFFDSQFSDQEFRRMRKAVVRRLYLVLENKTFERMFARPDSKLDLFDELNAGKLIVVNTSKATLKEQGAATFGRFFVALIAQASAERAQIPASKRTPAIVYIDEAHEYFDKNVQVILEQARKQNIGLFVAHQDLGQLQHGLQQTFEANTSIKIAGGVSNRDAKALSGQLNCSPEKLQHQPKGTFLVFLKGLTHRAVTVYFPAFVLENQPKRSPEAQQAFRDYQRATYATKLGAITPDPEDITFEPDTNPDNVPERGTW